MNFKAWWNKQNDVTLKMATPEIIARAAWEQGRNSMRKECVWKRWEDPDGTPVWNTTCGEDFQLMEGGPQDNTYNYCPSCGGKIEEIKKL